MEIFNELTNTQENSYREILAKNQKEAERLTEVQEARKQIENQNMNQLATMKNMGKEEDYHQVKPDETVNQLCPECQGTNPTCTTCGGIGPVDFIEGELQEHLEKRHTETHNV